MSVEVTESERRIRKMAAVIISSNLSANEEQLAEYLRTNITRIVQADRNTRTLNAVKTIAYELGVARDSERERLAPIVYEMVMAGRSAKEIAFAIRATTQPAHNRQTQNVESQVSVSALPGSGSWWCCEADYPNHSATCKNNPSPESGSGSESSGSP